MFDPLGLSIGTTNLVAMRRGTPPITRRAVLTFFPHRPPELGAPLDGRVNPANPNTTDTGTRISGFVERIGGSNALVSADGSTHDPALLLVEALDGMISATDGDVCTSNITIAVPAHWGPEALRALQDALRTDPGFARSGITPRLVSDAVTALTALNSGARLPASGMVALLDFGGGGTSMTLADAASGFTPIAETIRYPQFSGDFIDQALLFHVLDGIGHSNGHVNEADPANTAVVGRLAHLGEECRRAKERLSNETVTELVAELPGQRARVQVSRAELEDLIADRLNGVFSAFDDMLRRNGVHRRDLLAVAMAGGGARIPLVAQRLSSHARASVVTAVQPTLAMAVGAMMLAARRPTSGGRQASEGAVEQGQEVEAPTAIATMASASTGSFTTSTSMYSAATSTLNAPTGSFGATDSDAFIGEDPSETLRGLAWSQADDADKEPVLYTGDPYDDDAHATPSQYLPTIEPPDEPERRYRLPGLVFGMTALISMIAIGGVAYTLTSGTDDQAPAAPTSTTAVPPLPPASSVPPSPSPLPPPSAVSPTTSIAPPPPPPPSVTTVYQQPPTTTQQATTTTTTPTTTTTTTTPPTTTTPTTTTTTTTTVPMTTEYLRVPFVPVPIPVQVPENQGNADRPQNPFLSPRGG
jgi:cell division ATPase FtsA